MTVRELASIFWVVIGVLVAWHAHSLGLGRLHHPGPGFVFFLGGLFLALLGLVDLARALITRRGETKAGEPVGARTRAIKIVWVLAAMFGYVVALNLLGFPLSTFLFMLLLFRAVEPMPWWAAVAGSIVTTLIAFVIFEVFLNVPFPRRLLGF